MANPCYKGPMGAPEPPLKPATWKSSPPGVSLTSRIRVGPDSHRYSTSDDDSGCVMDEYAWVPSGLRPEAVHQYFSCLPEDKIPYVNSSGERWRNEQLEYQQPLQDGDARFCCNLSEMEQKELAVIEETRKRECYGIAVVERTAIDRTDHKCHQCKAAIPGDDLVVTAPDRFGPNVVWHPQCFVCVQCRQLLADMHYYKYDGNVMCGRHHAEQIKPRCARCDELIFCEECTEAEGRVWHLKHFVCTRCDCTLGGRRYILRNEQPYCVPCYHATTELFCNTCRKSIVTSKPHITQGCTHWHADERCFCCSVCHKNLLGKGYGLISGKLFCGVSDCLRPSDRDTALRIMQCLPRPDSSMSMPRGFSNPSSRSITPSGSGSPAISDRLYSRRTETTNNTKSPNRVKFDLQLQGPAESQRPKPPLRNPPPPPANFPQTATTPPENIYETVTMPGQMSQSSSPDLSAFDGPKKSRRRIRKRSTVTAKNNNVGDAGQQSESLSDSDAVTKPLSRMVVSGGESILMSPLPLDVRGKPRMCRSRPGNPKPPFEVQRLSKLCSSCSSSSDDSEVDDSYLKHYLASSDPKPPQPKLRKKKPKSSPFLGKKNANTNTPVMSTAKIAKNKKSGSGNCIVS